MPDLYSYLESMGKRPVEAVETYLAENVKALMAAHPELGSYDKFAKYCSVDGKTIQRIAKGAVSARIESVAKIAAAFDIDPWALLVEKLDPTNPPVLPRTPEELRLWAATRRAYKEIAEEAK